MVRRLGAGRWTNPDGSTLELPWDSESALSAKSSERGAYTSVPESVVPAPTVPAQVSAALTCPESLLRGGSFPEAVVRLVLGWGWRPVSFSSEPLRAMDTVSIRFRNYTRYVGSVRVWHTEGKSPFCLQRPDTYDIWAHGGSCKTTYRDYLHYMRAMHWLDYDEVDTVPANKRIVRPPQVMNKFHFRRGVAYGEMSWLKEIQCGSLSWYWYLQLPMKSGSSRIGAGGSDLY